MIVLGIAIGLVVGFVAAIRIHLASHPDCPANRDEPEPDLDDDDHQG